MWMDELPPSLLLEILSRLSDTTDLARCRLVSKTFNSLSYDVPSINLLCSMSRYIKSRSSDTSHLVTPFKTLFNDLVRRYPRLHSVSFGVDKSLLGVSFDDVEDESDDLYLTDSTFIQAWLPNVAPHLKSLSIADFWVQSCWRRSQALSFISSTCHSLVNLVIRNAWLSVDGLIPMPMLTSLTLEFVRLDDEDLSKINSCFPNLTQLNLIGVGGLQDPKMNLLHLTTCHWSVSNAPLSLTICAPKLVDFHLKCVRPRLIVLEAPSLSSFNLSLEDTDELKLINCTSIQYLQLESSNLASLFTIFHGCKTVKRLKVDSVKRSDHIEVRSFGLDTLFDSFPSIRYLDVGPGAWVQVETSYCRGGLEYSSGMKTLKEFVAHVMVVNEIESTLGLIFCVLDNCPMLSDVSLLIHRSVDSHVAGNLLARCRSHFPKVRWRWGMWEKGMKHTWVSDAT